MATQNNPLYLLYKDPGLHPNLVMPALGLSLLALIGIPMNASICYITLKYRKSQNSTLGSNTGLLLAINCFFEMLHQFSHFFFLAIAITGTNFIPVRWAILLEGILIVGYQSAVNMMVSLSFDRLLAISVPIFYRNLNQPIYLFAHLSFVIGANLHIYYQMQRAATNSPDYPVTGYMGDFFRMPGMDQSALVANFVAICFTILFYTMVGILIKFKTNVTSKRMQRLYRSLFLIVIVNVGSYFLANFYLVFSNFLGIRPMFSFGPIQNWTIGGTLINAGALSNGIILYCNSNDYKKAYQKEYSNVKHWFFNTIPNSQASQHGTNVMRIHVASISRNSIMIR